jgi:hypothetical protein
MIDIEKIPDFLVSRGIIIDNLSLNELIKWWIISPLLLLFLVFTNTQI